MRTSAGLAELGRNLALLVAMTVLADVVLAQVAKGYWSLWDAQSVERVYRVRSLIYHHDLARNVSTSGVWGVRRYPIRTNSLGFKDREVREVPLRSDRARILLIGDSFTEGIGVRFEDTYAGLLAEALGRRDFEVLNAAVASYSPAIYYRKTKYLLEEVGLDFDELVVLVDLSDIHDEATFYDLDQNGNVVAVSDWPDRLISHDQPESSDGEFLSAVRNNSVILQLSSLLLERTRSKGPDYGACRKMDDSALAAMTNLERSSWTINDSVFEKYAETGLEKARRNLDRLRALLRQHGKRMTLAVYPWPDQILSHDLHSKQVAYWSGWAADNGVPFIDLFPTFVTDESPEATIGRYFIPCDMHLNEAGHRRFAEAFLEAWRLHGP